MQATQFPKLINHFVVQWVYACRHFVPPTSNEAPPQTDEAWYNDSDIAPNAIFEDCIPVKGDCTISRAYARLVISAYRDTANNKAPQPTARLPRSSSTRFDGPRARFIRGEGEFVCIHSLSLKLDSSAMSFGDQVT